jgi:hydrogenase maturation protease
VDELTNNTLILGIGNILLNDEGIGIRVVQKLEEEGGITGVDLMDGGTGGFHLLGALQSYKTVIVVDASLDEHPPGFIRVLQPKFAHEFPKQLSAHEIGFRDMMEALIILDKMPLIYLLAVSVKDFQDMGLTLSPEVEAVIPMAVNKLRELILAIDPMNING